MRRREPLKKPQIEELREQLVEVLAGRSEGLASDFAEVEETVHLPHPEELSFSVLCRYSQPLAEFYLGIPKEEGLFYKDFLFLVLEKCPTERSLKRWLRSVGRLPKAKTNEKRMRQDPMENNLRTEAPSTYEAERKEEGDLMGD